MASKAAKILLLGCVVIVVAIVIAIAAGGFFLRSKFQEYTGSGGDYAEKSEQLNKEYPFTAPANGIVTEQQLLRFLEVRKRIHSVYTRYESEFKKLENEKPDLSVLTKGWGFIKDLRTTQTNALAAQKMSPDEYRYIVNAVYQTWMAQGTKDVLKDRTFNEVAKTELQESIEKIDRQLADPNTPEPARKALQKTREELQDQLKKVDQNSVVKKMDSTLESVPPENIKLFEKYEKELKQYSMSGLDLIGL